MGFACRGSNIQVDKSDGHRKSLCSIGEVRKTKTSKKLERLGRCRTHKVDVRLAAPTNRDLVKMVARGRFRSDLYYRLNVFPILLRAPRERRADIPSLVTHFVKMFSRCMGQQVESILPETMRAFQWHSRPGKVRELQNLLERATILSLDGVLPNPLPKRRTEVMPTRSIGSLLVDHR